MLDGAYVFPLELTEARKAAIQGRARQKLTEMLGVEVDNVMAEYVIVMVGNKKDMAQIARDLVDFIGDESAQQFAEWLSDMLKGLEAEQHKQTESPVKPAAAASKSEEAPADETKEKETKRVISLKGSSSSSSSDKRLGALSASRGSVRSLSSSSKDAADAMARRSQRFGAVEKPQQKQKAQQSEQKRDDSRSAGSKRKAGGDKNSEAPRSGRLAQLLGPPVNVDQAELDARDSLHTGKKTRRGRSAERPQQSSRDRRDRDDKGSDRSLKRKNDDSSSGSNKRRQQEDKNARGGNVAPPLPPPDDDRSNNKFGPNGRDGPQMGMFNGPPGYGGFPPYGGPMFYPPPGFAPPPYGMGFPPHGMPPQYGQFPPQGHHPRPSGGRAPRPFQNRTWVNPNIAKKEEAADAEGENNEAAGGSENASAQSGSLNPNAQTFAPRNPYYSSQMRPRFQNKTWVRQDVAKEEELSSSLPKTPPQESMES